MKNVILALIAVLSISSTVNAQDKGETTVQSNVSTTSMDVEFKVGHTDICTRVDAHTISCTRLEKGKKPVTFTVKL